MLPPPTPHMLNEHLRRTVPTIHSWLVREPPPQPMQPVSRLAANNNAATATQSAHRQLESEGHGAELCLAPHMLPRHYASEFSFKGS